MNDTPVGSIDLKALRRLAAVAAVVCAAGVGCAMPTQPPPFTSDAPVGPDSAAGTSPVARASAADLMFDDAQPFARPVSQVNVFGEVDGVSPGAFSVAGKSGFQQRTYVDEGYDADPALSPDGRWLIFSSTRHSEQADLYLQRVDGLAVTQLTDDPGDDAFPTFSPDGRRIAFASNRAGNWDIYVMDVDGRNVEPVTRGAAQELHPSFSPDGRRLVYSALGSRSGQWELWTVDLATFERRQIGYGLFPEWSPRADRDVIAFQRARQRGTRWFSAWTLDLVDGEAKNLTEVAFSTNAAIVAPTWSRDGRRLAFCTINEPQNADDSAGKRGGVQDVWTVSLDGTDRRRLSDGRGVNATPTWSPSGEIFFVSDRGGSESIWSATTSRPRNDIAATPWPTYPGDAPTSTARSPADGVFDTSSVPPASASTADPR